MAPSNLLRAMQPLRSTITTSILQPTRSSLLTRSVVSRQASTTSNKTASSIEKQQQAPQNPSVKTTVPPSLRNYASTRKTGTVISVGRMDRTVRVAYKHKFWHAYLQKFFPKTTEFLVSDPRDSLREGDVIEFTSGAPKSKKVRHVVERIIAPFGEAIEERPPVMSLAEREALRADKRAAKLQRREVKRLESGGEEGGARDHIGRERRLVLERTGQLQSQQA